MSCEYFADKGMKIDGNYWLVHPQTGVAWNDTTVADFKQTYEAQQILLEEERFAASKAEKLQEIKEAVFNKLGNEQWRVQKAQEHMLIAELSGDQAALGLSKSQLQELLAKREQLRKASDEAEVTIAEITTQAELDDFEFDVNISL
ncbi:hypothetical protein N474_04990 [Pseudoalteromonas luteoviolacea CPMOR-2]|uniref:Uncharacterized protein n=1 Tax=Pseudoalteromonas luteoviolacea DSM 6061 TaxID=1365250 RepID=A0A161ZXE0_9GAMM|nr:hypothetical protein [Pseudoalteromonas luteoviolacea]KZN37590.1 hypothetical protein N475_01900 [Pseudoalteromonas luteoviolacea DSM 6061]KZN49616.1 hypothetical protein N474_04990 [Pseudoalteromonas luteoviolacea CPMOR-2]MBE0386996.1 hypothetical protein [Pseudoalteromonas luteoviolacea DSM 6061]